MKSFKVLLLLLMFTVKINATYTEGSPPIFNIDELKVAGLTKDNLPQPKHQKIVSKDDGRVVVIQMAKDKKYLMRVDPPEHCSRFIICGIEDPLKDRVCASEKKSLVAFPSTGEIWKTENENSDKPENMEDLIRITTKSETEAIIQITDKEYPLVTSKYRLRIETSSFYCKVHIGTTGGQSDEAPGRYDIDFSNWKMIAPLPEMMKEGPEKKGLGPLFRAPAQKEKYEEDINSVCPFAHDWLGFAKWSLGKNDKTLYKDSLWENDIYEYSLRKQPSGCGGVDKPFQLDIEIDEFKPTHALKYYRCFGFALSFGKIFNDGALDAKRIFEFYVANMMFLAPDSEKIRALRTSREALRKIRISFYEKDYAIVEYGFLNNNIAGVRERVQLNKDFLKEIETVSLLSEGFCQVRILNVNHVSTATSAERCWHINGCKVFKKIKS